MIRANQFARIALRIARATKVSTRTAIPREGAWQSRRMSCVHVSAKKCLWIIGASSHRPVDQERGCVLRSSRSYFWKQPGVIWLKTKSVMNIWAAVCWFCAQSTCPQKTHDIGSDDVVELDGAKIPELLCVFQTHPGQYEHEITSNHTKKTETDAKSCNQIQISANRAPHAA